MPGSAEEIKTPLDKARKTLLSFRAPTLALIALFALLACSLFYYLDVSRRQAQFVKRAFRHLDLVGGEIALQTDNYYKAIANAPSDVDEQYLATFLPGVQFSYENPKGYQENTIISDEDNYYLFLKLTPASGKPLYLRAPIPALLKDTRATLLSTDIFDDVVLAAKDGNVIFQLDESGPRIIDVGALVSSHRTRDTKSDTVDKLLQTVPKVQAEQFLNISAFSNLLDVELAGAKYKLLLQPLRLRMKRSESIPDRPHYVLCGLLRSDRLLAESLRIPYTALAWGLFVVLLLSLSLPFLKMLLMKSSERFSRSDVIRLMLFTPIVVFVLTLCLVASCYFLAYDQSDKTLHHLADQIGVKFSTELARARAQLELLGTSSRFEVDPKVLDSIRRLPDVLKTEITSYDKEAVYPFFNSVFWMDPTGQHQILWTVRDKAPPLLNVGNRAYARDLFEQRYLYLRTGATQETPFTLEAINSWITGQNSAVICIPHPIGGAGMVTRPLSVVRPYLPPGFGFAVINQDGLVQFHSEEPRNLVENLFEETGMNSQLLLASRSHTDAFLDVSYHGKDHRMYVSAIRQVGSLPCTLIVFKDRALLRTTCINALTECVIGFASLYILECLLVYLIWRRPVSMLGDLRPRYLFQLFWPNEQRRSSYLLVGVGCVGGLVMTLVIFCTASPWFLMFATSSLALATATGSVYVFKHGRKLNLRKWENSLTTHWRAVYSASIVLILMLGAIVPCLAMFKIVVDYENRISTRQAQLSLAVFLEDRAEQVASAYRRVNFVSTQSREQFLNARLKVGKDALDSYQSVDGLESKETLASFQCHYHLSGPDELLGRVLSSLRPSHRSPIDRQVPADTDWQWCEDSRKPLLLAKHHYRNDRNLIISADAELLQPFENMLVWAGLFTLIVFLHRWLQFAANKLFPSISGPLPSLHNSLPPAEGNVTNTLVLCDPFFRAENVVHETYVASRVQVIDLAVRHRGPSAKSFEGSRNNKELIILDHFEFDIDDDKRNQKKLRLLEDFVMTKKPVFAISTIDPLPYFQSRPDIDQNQTGDMGRCSLIERWAAALSSFNRWYCGGVEEDHVSWELTGDVGTGTHLQPKGIDSLTREDIFSVLKKECGGCPILRGIGINIAANVAGTKALTSEMLFDELLNQAAARYRVLWSGCPPKEKLLLVQLAQEGYVNPNNRPALRELVRKKLLNTDPAVRIFNESFRRFVVAAETPEQIKLWEQEGESRSWKILRIVFWTGLGGLAAFFLYTQRDILQSSIALLSALGGGIAALLKAFEVIQRKRSESGVKPA